VCHEDRHTSLCVCVCISPQAALPLPPRREVPSARPESAAQPAAAAAARPVRTRVDAGSTISQVRVCHGQQQRCHGSLTGGVLLVTTLLVATLQPVCWSLSGSLWYVERVVSG